MKCRLIKIYINGVLVAKHLSDKPLSDCVTSFIRTRRVIGIHLDGRVVRAEDPRGIFREEIVATPKGRRIATA